jgi:hypothetical protein
MNGNALIRILATFGLLVASLWVAFDIFTSGSNAIARFYMYVMIVAGVYGLLNARRAFYVLLFLTGYLDFFKRFMIFDSGLSRLDLYYVLGIAPATLAGITGNILYQYFTGRLPGRPGLNKLIIGVLIACGLSLAMALVSSKGGFRSIGDSVNASIYFLLLFIVPVLFRTPHDLRRLLRTLVILYIPAVGYMLVHFWRGIFDWEMEYLKSGLTIEIRQLMERTIRPFGTMNSAANASMVFAGIWALCWSRMWRSPAEKTGHKSPLNIRYLLIPALAVAMYATLSRAGWVFAVVALGTMPLLRSRAATLFGYTAVITAMVTVVLAAPYLLKHRILNEISNQLFEEGSGERWQQTINISTLNDRLAGFAALATSPVGWTPFGARMSGNESAVRNAVPSHDVFTDLLMSYGFVPIIVVGLILLWLLWKLHSMIFREKEPLARSIAVSSMAIALATCSGATVNGAQFLTYPVNAFIWFHFAVVVSIYIYTREREIALAAEAVSATGAEVPPWMPRNPARPAAPRPSMLPAPAHAKI